MILIAVILFVAFVLIAAGDCYSTAKILRYNHRLLHDKKFKKQVDKLIYDKLRKDESNAEMSNPGRKLIQKYGGDRAMLYIFVFGYEPIALIILYFLCTDFENEFVFVVALVCFFFGILYGQIWKALTLKKRFGFDFWKMEEVKK